MTKTKPDPPADGDAEEPDPGSTKEATRYPDKQMRPGKSRVVTKDGDDAGDED